MLFVLKQRKKEKEGEGLGRKRARIFGNICDLLHANAPLSPSATVNINWVTVLHTIKIIPTIPQLLITFQHSTNVKSRWVCPALIFPSSSPYREDTSLPLILFLPNDNAEISIEKEVSDAFEQHAPSAGVELSLLFCCVYFISLFFPSVF